MSKKHTTSELSLLINDIDINNKYQLLSKIGEGSYGVVWLVVPTNSHSIKSQTKQYVLKRINLNQSPHKLSQNEIEYAVNEAKLLSTLKHPNIVTYKESFRSNDGFINIVMAYCEGGDLYTILQAKKFKKEHLKENKILEWFIQICMALKVNNSFS
jgi:NIMA (never in mitosis gene a)-related kinase